ncbi:hypothetical protein Tco_0734355 [Tanacetum coccineum]
MILDENVTSSKTDERIDKLADQLLTLVEIVSKKVVTPAPVKSGSRKLDVDCVVVLILDVKEHAKSNQFVEREYLKNEIQNTIKSQQAVMMNQQTTFFNNLQNMICGLFQNQASTSSILTSNTIPNLNGEMKAITTRSGVAYEGPSI